MAISARSKTLFANDQLDPVFSELLFDNDSDPRVSLAVVVSMPADSKSCMYRRARAFSTIRSYIAPDALHCTFILTYAFARHIGPRDNGMTEPC